MQPPTTTDKKKVRSNKSYLMQYAGMASQLMAALGVGVFIGYKLDGSLHLSFPVFIWALPLVSLIAMFVKIIKDTDRKNEP